jgi:3-isopropylmalate/(R)-2-methylmalate dehydratase large subunit
MREQQRFGRLPGGQRLPQLSLFDKIWQQHVIGEHGERELLAIDRIFLHERMGSVALQSLAAQGRKVQGPDRVFCTIDHIVDTRPGRGDDTQVPNGREFIEQTRAAARAAAIRLFDVNDPDQGIVHVISAELGLALPGCTIVCPDSHTCTQGAVGALAWGIGSTEAEHALATGTLRVRKPQAMRVRLEGALDPRVSAKDVSLLLIGRYGAAGARGKVVEFTGSAVRALGMEARMTLCNMASEWSAASALIAPDDCTFDYLAQRRYAPAGAAWDAAVKAWRRLHSDTHALFEPDIDVNVTDLAPMVTWGTSPQHAVSVDASVPDAAHSGASQEAYARALHYMDVQPGTQMTALPIDAAYIGSCTNGRITDLRVAARVLAGRRIAHGVRALCVPGSSSVKHQAEAEGLDQVFRSAGFEWRESGCALCFYAGGESLGSGARVISSTNRNFEGRQGTGTRTHIASPATVAASALQGHIADVRTVLN